MVVIHNNVNTGILWSIDTDRKCLTKIFDFPGRTSLHFTPDDKYIVVNKEIGPTLWSLAEGKFTNNPIHFLDNGSNYMKHNNLVVQSVVSCSPNNRQCIVKVHETGTYNRYITSYFVK